MILGAGVYQLPAIRRAVELGCRVITVDNNKHNTGHRFAHDSVNASTLDVDVVIDAARRLRIDGIATFASDIAVPTVAAVTARLGLPGCGVEPAGIMSNKARFRRFQSEVGLLAPRFRVIDSPDLLPDVIRGLSRPLVFKPVDSSGSRGVTTVAVDTEQAMQAAYDNARWASQSGSVCVEEFIQGVEVGVEAFLLDEELLFCGVTNKHKRGVVVTGHSQRPSVEDKDIRRIEQSVIEICRSLGYRAGALNCDVIVTPRGICCLELSPRQGGNGLPQVLERAYGVDLTTWTILHALGRRPVPPTTTPSSQQQCGSLVFGASTPGRLEQIADEAQLREAVPEVFGYLSRWRCGDETPQFTHGGSSLGCVLFDIPDAETYEGMCLKVERALGIRIKPSSSSVHTATPVL